MRAFEKRTKTLIPTEKRRLLRVLFGRVLLFLSITFAGIFLLSLRGKMELVHGQIAVQNQGYVPFSDQPINYRLRPLNDPIARLQRQLDRAEVRLDYDPQFGYLRSLLEKLKIPISSQTLVFSKTSFQYKKISPQTPRALYFNDDVYVGFVHEGKALEIVSFDPVQGAIFYLLDVPKVDHPLFQRAELDCTQCHIAAGTRNVPGVLLRSVYTRASGTQAIRTTSYITGQESPLSERWGGWYVTGTHGHELHMGNVVVQDEGHSEQLDRAAGANIVKLTGRFDASFYLTGDSDIVAHLVLAHQTQMHNLITLTNYQARIALYNAAKHQSARNSATTLLTAEEQQQYKKPAEELLRYLLFTNEASLEGPIRGTSSFAQDFAALGPRDPRGRSLRDFDLRKRIFKYPCSYLIYSESFDSLPSPAKEYIYHRLFEVLTGLDQSPDFAHLTKEDRRAVLEILLATKQGLPAEWKQYQTEVLRTAQYPSPS